MVFALVEGVDTVMVFVARTGVVRLPAGRDSSAGLMSGILTVFGRGGHEMTTVRMTGDREAVEREQSGDVACREDAYRDAAGTIIQACDESPGLRDHILMVELMKYVDGEEEWMRTA